MFEHLNSILEPHIPTIMQLPSRLFVPALETLYMVSMSTLLSFVFGIGLAIVLVITGPKGLSPCQSVYRVLDFIVNLLRSFPFIILIIAMIPITRWIIGTPIGNTATILPLTVAAAPFVARIMEASFMEVDEGIIEAARSFGASNMQIIFKVMFKEALPATALNVAVTAINLIGYSAMAGAVGGGGLGHTAIMYGYYRFEALTMYASVIVLIVIVQLIQMLGNLFYRVLK